MKVLFDQGTPVPLRRHLHPHFVDTTAEKGWSTLQNGELLNQAESGDYEAFVTTDRNLRYQQNLTGRTIRILVLTTTSWPRISKKVAQIRQVLENLGEGGYVEVEI
jgi:predicted nuclease of predicted toxin-antitoxin system